MENAPDFTIQEFVSKEAFTIFGEQSTRLIHPQISVLAQKARDFFNKRVIINNWYWGGSENWSGLRTPDSPYYKPYSPHSRGMAIDIKVDGLQSLDVQQAIRETYRYMWIQHGLGLMEWGTEGWTHLSIENFGVEGLMIYDVNKKTLKEDI